MQEASKFAVKLDTGHDNTCPWRKSACDPGLAVFPALLPDAVITEFDQRAAALSALSALPPIAKSAFQLLCKHRRYLLTNYLSPTISDNCS